MLAIAVLRSRVAPVLDWCSRFILFSKDEPRAMNGREVSFEGARQYEALKNLRGMGVGALICGALTPELLEYADHLGLQIIHGIAGAVPDVLKAYRTDELHHPGFWLPGCRGHCPYRRMWAKVNNKMTASDESVTTSMPLTPQKEQQQGRRGRGGCARAGTSMAAGARCASAPDLDVCVCPHCGTESPHRRGIPCARMQCPKCQQPMGRKGP